MKLKEYLDDVESICSTCDACDSSCAGHMFKNCFKSELEIEEVLKFSNTEIGGQNRFNRLKPIKRS